MNKSIKHKFYAVLVTVALLATATGCDKNAISPEDLDNYGGLSIVKFTADKDVPIALKQSITFTFKIDDADKEFDHLVITDDQGNEETLKATEGTKSITPPATTDYQMHVYAKGENDPRVSTQPLHVEVYDPEHPDTLIITPSVDETPDNKNCSDGIDNNYGSGTDCDDPGCATDEKCVDKYAITYSLSSKENNCHSCEGIENCSCSWSTSATTDVPEYTQGDEVTIEWQAPGCSYITLLDESEVEHYYQPIKDGSYVVKLTDEARAADENNIKTYAVKLYCLAEGFDLPKSEAAIEIKAYVAPVTVAPTFNAAFTTSVSSPSIIKGDTIVYTWDITSEYTAANVNYLGEDHPITEKKGSVTLDAGDYGDETSVVFKLTLTDSQGISNEENPDSKTVTINDFVKCSDCTTLGSVKKAIPGHAKNTYYVLTNDNEIYATSDAGKTFVRKASFEETVSVIAVDSAENFYAATSSGIYINGNRTQVSKLGATGASRSVNAIYAKDSDLILAGTTDILFKFKPKGNDCDSGWHSESDDFSYCYQVADFAGNASGDEVAWNNTSIAINAFMPNLASPGVVIAVSDVGTYISDDAGENFEDRLQKIEGGNNSISFVDGFLKDTSTAYLWTDDSIYTYAISENTVSGNKLGMGGINASDTFSITSVTNYGEIQFMGTTEGLYYELPDDTTWTKSALTSPVIAVIASDSSGVAGQRVVRVLLNDGKIYELTWSDRVLHGASFRFGEQLLVH